MPSRYNPLYFSGFSSLRGLRTIGKEICASELRRVSCPLDGAIDGGTGNAEEFGKLNRRESSRTMNRNQACLLCCGTLGPLSAQLPLCFDDSHHLTSSGRGQLASLPRAAGTSLTGGRRPMGVVAGRARAGESNCVRVVEVPVSQALVKVS